MSSTPSSIPPPTAAICPKMKATAPRKCLCHCKKCNSHTMILIFLVLLVIILLSYIFGFISTFWLIVLISALIIIIIVIYVIKFFIKHPELLLL